MERFSYTVNCSVRADSLLIVARGGTRFSGKGVVMYKGLCVCVCGGGGVALLILSIFS